MKLEKFFPRRKERISKIGRRGEKNLTLKFFFALNVLVCREVSYPFLFIGEEPTQKRKTILIWSGR